MKREEEMSRANGLLPHESVEADIHVEEFSWIYAHLAQAGLASRLCVGKIMSSQRERFEATTSLAGRINLAQWAWIGMRNDTCLVRVSSRSLVSIPLR